MEKIISFFDDVNKKNLKQKMVIVYIMIKKKYIMI